MPIKGRREFRQACEESPYEISVQICSCKMLSKVVPNRIGSDPGPCLWGSDCALAATIKITHADSHSLNGEDERVSFRWMRVDKRESRRLAPDDSYRGSMLKIGNKIRLTDEERKFLDVCAERVCDPHTEEELAAWIAYAKTTLDLREPECRLLAALLDMLARDEFGRKPTSL